MRFTKAALISTLMLALILPSFEAGARVGSRSSMSSRSMSAPSSAPQRVGSGGNAGMQRPDVMNQARSQSVTPQPGMAPQPAAAPVATQPAARPGFGVGSMVGAAAAGAAVGYLANSAMHSGYNQPVVGNNTGNNADPLAANQATAGSHSSPWGFILLLLAGTAAIMGGLMLLSRRREANDRSMPAAMMRSNVSPISGAQPDAEQQAFERNALKFFNDLQEANNRGDIAHIEAFTAEPLRSQLLDDLRSRSAASRTQTMTMKAERIDLTEEAARSIASVRFRGMVSEDENAAPDRIDEVWHFVRERQADSQWQLAGIEQV